MRAGSSPASSKDTLLLVGVSACFLLSGFAALLYQTAWLRQFSIVFGTSELAVATVLAAYMAGLGLGAAIAGRFIHRITRPVLVYGVLEAGIAASALCVPLLLKGASSLLAWVLGGQAEPPASGGLGQPLYYLAASFIILAIPTGFMGATLPLLTRYAVTSNAQVGPRVAWLYGINTVGAVFGTLTAAFLLLPKFGLNATVWFGVAINALVFVLAAWLARNAEGVGVSDAMSEPAEGALKKELPGNASWIFPLMLLSGVNSFLYEVLWTRLLSHVLGGTVYAFATMLASFLTGIAIGGLLAGSVAKDRHRASLLFVVSQVAIAVLSVGIYSWLQSYVPGQTGLGGNVGLAALVMLPATLFIGATFPLAVRIGSTSAADAGLATARTYAWNTAGAIVGSIAAGFFLIPFLGFEGAVKVAVGVNLLIAAACLFLISQSFAPASAAAAAAALFLFFYRAATPFGLIDSSIVDPTRGGESVYYAVGRSATVFMKRHDGYFYLRTNGLPEAFIEPSGAPPILHSQKWLTALPVAARPDASSMLIVGFGGGVAIEGVPPTVEEIDVVELEPEVINANRTIADRRRYDPLADPRVSIIANDARNALTLTRKTYDVVVSQPSHPWTAGASHLYTREFVSLAKEHLADNGVFVQWINTNFVDAALLKVLSATLLDQFKNVRLYQPSPTVLLFIASEGPLDVEADILRDNRPLSVAPLHYASVGINAVEDLLVALTADEAGVRRFADGAAVNTDDNNRMALFSRSSSDGMNHEELFELLEKHDPLLDDASWVYRDLRRLNFGYLGYRLIAAGFRKRAAALSRSLPDASTGALVAGLGQRFEGLRDASRQSLRAALGANPKNQQALYALVWPYLGSLARGGASAEIVELTGQLEGSAAAVIEGWVLGLQQDWRGLSRLDRVLNETDPTDLWYPEAVKLRADWRIQGMEDRRAASDARRMLDRALMVNALTDLLVIRAGAAIRMEDPSAFVETAEYVHQRIRDKLERAGKNEYVLSSRERRTMEERVRGFSRQLESSFVAPISDRAAEVKAHFDELPPLLSATVAQ